MATHHIYTSSTRNLLSLLSERTPAPGSTFRGHFTNSVSRGHFLSPPLFVSACQCVFRPITLHYAGNTFKSVYCGVESGKESNQTRSVAFTFSPAKPSKGWGHFHEEGRPRPPPPPAYTQVYTRLCTPRRYTPRPRLDEDVLFPFFAAHRLGNGLENQGACTVRAVIKIPPPICQEYFYMSETSMFP